MATFSKLPSGSWRAQVRIRGHAPVSKTFRTKAMAERWATGVEDQIRSGSYRDTSSAEGRSLKTHLDWYLGQVTARKSKTSQVREESRIRLLQGHALFKHCTLATLTPELVLSYVDDRKKAGAAAATITRELALLGHAIEAGIGLLRLHLPHGNPVRQARSSLRFTKTLVIRDARDRRLNPGEEERLLAELGPYMRAVVILILETGMRREEVSKARREHIRGSTLHIPEAKATGAKTGGRTIPLSPAALDVLRNLPSRLDGRLIPLRPDSITQAFARACKRAGIDDLRPHDLRHEAISRLYERGWSDAEVSAMSGHKDRRCLDRYTHISPDHLAEKLKGHPPPKPRQGSGSD